MAGQTVPENGSSETDGPCSHLLVFGVNLVDGHSYNPGFTGAYIGRASNYCKLVHGMPCWPQEDF